MLRILARGTLRQVVAVRPLLLGVAIPRPPVVLCCCALRLPSTADQRYFSTSAISRAAHQPKHQPTQEEPPSDATTPQSQDAQKGNAAPDPVEVDPLQDKSIGLVQRFKRTFKQYGKVMIPVHLATSSVWFGTFYYAAMK